MTARATEAAVLAAVFLAVSVGSAVIQGASLWRLVRLRPTGTQQRRVHTGMVRTAVCRVTAAAAYVVVGLITLLIRESLPVLVLVVFCSVQVMWQLNAWADLRLRRSLNASHPLIPPPDPGKRR